MSQAFWKPEPKEPLQDWRTYFIGVPVLFSAFGACLFMALSFSFTELEAIPLQTKVSLVIAAAFATAIGSAFGSVGSGIEIYKKAFENTAIWLDWTSLALSVLATLGGFVMGFAALLGATEQWSEVARTWGPVVLSALVALDAAGDLIELGGLFAAYNIRYKAWLEEKRQWDAAQASIPVVKVEGQEEIEINEHWPVARIGDFRRVLGRLNGQRGKLDAKMLEYELAQDEKQLPQRTTVYRWLKMARTAH